MKTFFCVVVLALLAAASAFQPSFVARSTAVSSPAARHQGVFSRRSSPRTSCLTRMQFGGSDEDTPKITRETEPENYFQTNLDKASTDEKLKDPIVLIAFGWLGFMAVLATGFILAGVQ